MGDYDYDYDDFYRRPSYSRDYSTSRYWHMLEQAESNEAQNKSKKDDQHHREEQVHYLHGSQDVAHHSAYADSEDTRQHDHGEWVGKYTHGSEDVAHHQKWYHMLEALEQAESARNNGFEAQIANFLQ